MQLTIMPSMPAIICACFGGTFAVLANTLCFVMIGKINERVPDSERLSYLWWGTEVRKKFRQICPGNRLVLMLDCCVVLMVLSFLCLLRVWVFS